MGGIWVLFERAECVLSKGVLSDLTKWLKNDVNSVNRNSAVLFISIFNRIFGKKHLSLKCFSKSILVSFVVVTVFVFNFLNEIGGKIETFNIYAFIIFLMIAFIYNMLIDYFSLFQTRIFLNWMKKKETVGKISVLILDLLTTTSLIFFTLLLFNLLTDNFFLNFSFISEMLHQYYSALFFLDSGEGESVLLSPIVYSTYFSSVWLWLYFVGGLIIKGINFLGVTKFKIASKLNVEEKPLTSIGFVCMTLVTIFFVILLFV